MSKLTLSFLLASAILAGQEVPGMQVSVTGEVDSQGLIPGEHYSVQLYSITSGKSSDVAPLEPDGRFQLRRVETGIYFLRLISEPRGEVLSQQAVTVESPNQRLDVRFPMSRGRSGHPGLISVRELRIPEKARKDFAEASRLAQAGKLAKAVEKLKRAIAVYPEFYEAHSNLGNLYFRLGEYEDSLAAFEQAAATGPLSEIVQTNLAIVLTHFGRNQEAERSARQALKVEPKSARAHYVLGYLLAISGRSEEASDHLSAAAPEMPQAGALRDRLPGLRVPVIRALK